MKRSAGKPGMLAELEADFERVERELSLIRVAGKDGLIDRYDADTVVDDLHRRPGAG